MANEVYANNMEISCKAADGKSVACFPDVCFTPPQAPPTPTGVPIPYPNTGMAKDTTKGSRTVKISRKEVMLKNRSYFKTSYGDEAGCAPKKGVITSKIKGKVYFTSWSMNVKFEGENVVRNLDLTTHNHASPISNTPTWPYIDQANPAAKDCEDDMTRVTDGCPNAKTKPEEDCDKPECRKAKRCMLVPYTRSEGAGGCCETPKKQTGHHLIPKHCFKDVPGYNENHAPVVCTEGYTFHRNCNSPYDKAEKTHPQFHEVQDVMERRVIAAFPVMKKRGTAAPDLTKEKPWRYSTARNIGVATHGKVFNDPKCNQKCLLAQLDAYHKQSAVNIGERDPVIAKKVGNKDKANHPSSVAVWAQRLKEES
ncbi:PAAR-like domain-containing protein [Pseudomonas farris]